jgi:hypothetical protein
MLNGSLVRGHPPAGCVAPAVAPRAVGCGLSSRTGRSPWSKRRARRGSPPRGWRRRWRRGAGEEAGEHLQAWHLPWDIRAHELVVPRSERCRALSRSIRTYAGGGPPSSVTGTASRSRTMRIAPSRRYAASTRTRCAITMGSPRQRDNDLRERDRSRTRRPAGQAGPQGSVGPGRHAPIVVSRSRVPGFGRRASSSAARSLSVLSVCLLAVAVLPS